MALANTFGLAMIVIWVVCSAFVWLFPQMSLTIANWWMHGLDMSTMGEWNLTITSFVMGGVTAIASGWISGWILGWSWEQVNDK